MPELTLEQAKRRIGHVIRVKTPGGGQHWQPGKLIEVDERRERVGYIPNGHGQIEWLPLRWCRRWHARDVEAGIVDPEPVTAPRTADIEIPDGHVPVMISIDNKTGRAEIAPLRPTSGQVDRTLSAAAKRFGPENRVQWPQAAPRAAVVDHAASPVPSPADRPAESHPDSSCGPAGPAPDAFSGPIDPPDVSTDAPAVRVRRKPSHDAGPVNHVLYDLDTMEVWAGTAWGFVSRLQQPRWKRMTRQDARRLVTLLAKEGGKGFGRRLAADPVDDLLELMTEPSPLETAVKSEPPAIVSPVVPEPVAPMPGDSIGSLLAELSRVDAEIAERQRVREDIRGKLRVIKSQLESAGI